MARVGVGIGIGRRRGGDAINTLALYDFNFATGQIKGAQWSDAVVTRASTAYALNASGVYESFSSNVLRRTNLGVTIEEARQNLLLQSSGFSTSWAAGAGGDVSVTANSGTAPDGTNTAVLLGDASNASVLGRSQAISITSGTSLYTTSVHLKAGTSSIASLRVLLTGGTALAAEGIINLANGATQWRSGASGTTLSSVSLGNGWYRLIVTVTDNASGNNSLGFEVRPAFASTYSNVIDVAAQGNALAWGAQVELGSFATTPIITSGSALTRPADVVYWPVSGVGLACSLYTDTQAPPTGISVRSELWNSINDRAGINHGVTAASITMVGGGSVSSAVSSVNYSGNRKAAARIETGNTKGAASGSLGAVSLGAVPTLTPTRLYVGSAGAGGSPFYSNQVIRRLAILPALTDAQLQEITA